MPMEEVQRCADYIEENMQTDVTARELAALSGFSAYHFYRLFQQPENTACFRRTLFFEVGRDRIK